MAFSEYLNSLPATHYNTVTILYKIWYKGTKTCNKHIFHLFLDDSHNESLILFATFNWHTYINKYVFLSDRECKGYTMLGSQTK